MFRLKLLGSLDISGAEGAPGSAPVRRLKPLVLLAYLAAARPRGFQRRDKLTALFWPELSTERARAALRVSLSRLRDDFGDDLFTLRGASDIAVNSDQLWCDVAAFDTAMAESRFEDAVALYRGPLLDGVHVEGTGAELEDWIDAERSRLLRDAVRAGSALSLAAEARGDNSEAVRAAEWAHALNPSDESTARRTISLLIAAGDHGGAMRVHDELARRLQRELGVELSAETAALVGALRQPLPAAANTAANVSSATSPTATIASGVGALHVAPRTSMWRSNSVLAASVLAAIAVGAWLLAPAKVRSVAAPVQTVEWQNLRYDTITPPARFGGQAVLDSTGNALLLLGGQIDARTHSFAPLGQEVWRLSGLRVGQRATWTRIATAPGPHPTDRWLFGASYDTPHDRIVLHGGGLGQTSPCTNDTWILEHASGLEQAPVWRQVSYRGSTPPARGGFDQIFDAAHRRLIVFAGHDCIYPHFDDTWVLAFDDETLTSGEWSRLWPDSSAGIPRERDLYAAAYDTASGRMFVFGGRASMLASSELWALEHANGLGGRAAWRRVECAGEPPARISAAATYDAKRDVWTLVGGTDENANVTRDVWMLRGVGRDLSHCRWEHPTAVGRVPAERSAANAMLLPESRGIVLFGGSFDSTPLGDTWLMRAVPVR
jgi:DNA-binding SARP family transcriptional activator